MKSNFPVRVAALPALALLASCATAPPASAPALDPEAIRADIARRLPSRVDDKAGWANDVYVALSSQDIAPNAQNICAVLAVAEQESDYRTDPVIPNLGRIARAELTRRAGERGIPSFAVSAALMVHASDGISYGAHVEAARTERELSGVFDDFADSVPLGHRLLDGFNPVHTGGPMQVDVRFAQAHRDGYPYSLANGIRNEVFSRHGSVWFGAKHLFGYEENYDAMLYRFADFNAGWYASRNAAFQAALSKAGGIALELDGDVLTPDAGMDEPGATERAARALHARLDMSDAQIRDDLEKGETREFEDTDLYKQVFALAEAGGAIVPRAILPGIKLESPKITRDLTTAWFAKRVDERWNKCLAK